MEHRLYMNGLGAFVTVTLSALDLLRKNERIAVRPMLVFGKCIDTERTTYWQIDRTEDAVPSVPVLATIQPGPVEGELFAVEGELFAVIGGVL